MGEKVLISTSSGGRPRAIGIEVATGPDSPRFLVSAAREVILCGGAVGTPQVLLLSGVGPADELVELDIPPGSSPCSSGKSSVEGRCPPWAGLPQHLYALWITRMSSDVHHDCISRLMFFRVPHYVQGECRVVPVNDRTSGPDVPDLELIWFPLTVFDDAFPKPPPGTSGITLAAVALRPESRGRITLRSASAWDKPVIDPKCVPRYVETDTI